jgi:hypothetical protein
MLTALIPLIIEKQAALAEDASLCDAVNALLEDAGQDFIAAPNHVRASPGFARCLMDLDLAPADFRLTARLRRRPASAFNEARLFAVLGTVPSLIKPVALRGIGSRRADLWRLLFLVALGFKMSDIAVLLREPRMRKSEAKQAAKGDKYLWRLRTRALRSVADAIAPLI